MATTLKESSDLTLYFNPGSYYSHKVLLALYEKGLPFKEHLIYIHHGEQNSDWYLSMNPKGEVPVLKDGNDIISDSEVIIDYLDSKYKTEPVLVPEIGTPVGQEVAEFRKLLHDIPIDQITFGLMANRQFVASEFRLPYPLGSWFNRKNIEKSIDASIAIIKTKLTTCTPELREGLQGRLGNIQRRKAQVFDEEKVALLLDNLEQVFDKIEDRLEKSKKDISGSADVWLFGANLCAADITATTLLFRLYVLGLDLRYFSDVKRPLVYDYYKRLMERPAVQKVVAAGFAMGSLYMKRMLKTTAIKAVKIGFVIGVVALGVVGVRKYF